MSSRRGSWAEHKNVEKCNIWVDGRYEAEIEVKKLLFEMN